MGFSSRSYARPYVMGGGLPRGVKFLIVANVVVFVITFLAGDSSLGRTIISLFALRPLDVVTNLYLWQLVTWMFLHDGFFHILFNMLALWFFGSDLERQWGTDQFLKFYFFCGIGSGIMVVLGNYLAGTPQVFTLGASGAVYGVLLVSAVLWPDRIIIFYIFPIKLKYFVMILAGIAFFGLGSVGGGVSHIAHLSGMAFGYLFLKMPHRKGARSVGYGGTSHSGPSFGRSNPLETARDRYKKWKLERAKKKFQVYLRKHGSDRDPWVH